MNLLPDLPPETLRAWLEAFTRLDAVMVGVESTISRLTMFLALALLSWAMIENRPLAKRWIGLLVAAPFLLSTIAYYQAVWFNRLVPFPGYADATTWLGRRFSIIAIAVAGGLGVLALARDGVSPLEWHSDPLRRSLSPTALERTHAVRYGALVAIMALGVAFAVFFHGNYLPSGDVRWFNELLLNYPPDVLRCIHLAVMINAVILEELECRLFVQGALVLLLTRQLGRPRREAAWLAILCSALLWTWAHSTSFQFPWAKYLQIFPFGLMLGYLMERHGFWACIMAHGMYNALILGYSTMLGYWPEVH